MYESPIHIAQEELVKHVQLLYEDGIYKAVLNCGIAVDKKELIRALRYDRGQYEKGYADGQRDAVKHGRWVADKRLPWKAFCSECHHSRPNKNDHEFPSDKNYCPNCGADMRGDQ